MTNQINHLPGLHPSPPDNLSKRKLPLITFLAGTIFFRVYQAKYSAIHYGNSMCGRFDTPEGVLYLGLDETIVFRETIGRFSQYRLISTGELEKRRMALIRSIKKLSLVDLTGNGLTLLDADVRLLSGDYKIAQEWSKALQDHGSQPDGIYYRFRHDPSRFCLALYREATNDILEIDSVYDFLSDEYEKSLAAILDEYHYGLI
jgi:hypothetical protein